MLAKSVNHWFRLVAFSLLGIGAPAAASAAPPTQISACPYTITAPGDYVVTRDLTATGTCIDFAPAMKSVGLDLQGNSITGNGTGYGIVCLRSSIDDCGDILVANGVISRFSEGILIQGNSNAVAHLTSKQNTGAGSDGIGIALIGLGTSNTGKSNAVSDCSATENASAGIVNRFGSGNTVNNSRADNNGYDGIQSDGPVTNSEANNNGHAGIVGISVINSTAKNNAETGIFASLDGTLESTASSNGGDGILTNGNIIASTAKNNGGVGINLTCPATAYGNTAINNAGGDLVTSDNSCVLLDNKTH